MHREQVIDALWPGLSWEAAAPRLHKAAHYARRALDDPDAVVLRHELVALFPGRDDVEVDVHEFTRTAAQALQTGDEALAAEALEWYAGPLLPARPLRAVDRRGSPGGAPAAPRPPAAAGSVGRRAGRGARRRGRAPGPGQGARRGTVTSAGPSSSSNGSSRRCTASSVPRPDRRPCDLRTELERSTAAAQGTTGVHRVRGRRTGRPSLRTARRG